MGVLGDGPGFPFTGSHDSHGLTWQTGWDMDDMDLGFWGVGQWGRGGQSISQVPGGSSGTVRGQSGDSGGPSRRQLGS